MVPVESRTAAGMGRQGSTVLLELEKVGHYAAVYCNAKLVGEHTAIFTIRIRCDRRPSPGQANGIAIYVHNASGKYARRARRSRTK